MAQINQDLRDSEVQSFDVLPPGWYEATIDNSEVKQGGKGPYINWCFKLDNGRKVFDIMSLTHDIGLSRLKTLATCAGYKNPNYLSDTEELHGAKIQVKLVIEPAKDGYDEKNKVTSFKPLANKVVEVNLAEKQPESSQSKKPWEK